MWKGLNSAMREFVMVHHSPLALGFALDLIIEIRKLACYHTWAHPDVGELGTLMLGRFSFKYQTTSPALYS